MSTETDKRCGTCKWYRAICATWGSCGIPVPDCLDIEDKAEMHATKAGTDCPCWEPKQ